MTIEHTTFNLPESVRGAVLTLFAPAKNKGLTLYCHLSPDLPPLVLGDPMRVRQILLNLIGNAIKFTASGFVRVTVAKDGDWTRFLVEDSGIGMTPAQQKTIFGPFQQADTSTTRIYGGTGLGLSIVAELVRLMHGTIHVESRPGAGTRFQVDLRLEALTGQCFAEPSAPRPAADKRALSILVAEDNPVNQLVTSRLLQSLGHSVCMVADGQAALRAVEQSRFDLVLMDLQMPVMDGLEAAGAIRRRERAGVRIPIVALTAQALSSGESELRDAGIDACVSKPVRSEQLREVIAEYCR